LNPVHVISLSRSADRRETFRRNNSHLAFDFVDAVDGSTLTRAQVGATGHFLPGLHYSAGAYGAALSHLKLWQQAARGDAPMTIAEDDAIFRHDFAQAQARLLEGLAPGWEFVLWGWNFDAFLSLRPLPGLFGTMGFDATRLLPDTGAFQAATSPVHAFRLVYGFGLPAYTLSPAGAARLIAACFPLQDFGMHVPVAGNIRNEGIDIATNRVYGAMEAFACFPPLVVTPNDRARSTIQNGAPLRG
jgi:GR25 family glycosyltransferase involved in LPS biosynthesis